MTQQQRITELSQWGVVFKALNVPGGSFGCLHSKLAIIDGATLLTGSCKLTHNGFTNNAENVLSTSALSVMRTAQARFEELWLSDRARWLTQAEITVNAIVRHEKRDSAKKAAEDKKKSQQLPSSSASQLHNTD